MTYDVIREVRLMHHQQYWSAWVIGHGAVEVRQHQVIGIVASGKPEALRSALNGEEAIHQYWSSMGFQRLNYMFSSNVHVVVAEHSEALRRFESREDFGANACCLPRHGVIAWSSADEITSE